MDDDCSCDSTCDMCGEDLHGRQWILLNRYSVSAGSGRIHIEVRNEGVYRWDMHDDPDQDVTSGSLLCWPVCAVQWIEGQQIEGAVLFRQKFGGA